MGAAVFATTRGAGAFFSASGSLAVFFSALRAASASFSFFFSVFRQLGFGSFALGQDFLAYCFRETHVYRCAGREHIES